MANPWKHLGCEVNLCQARQCDPQRMEICALRIAYLTRRQELQTLLTHCRRKSSRAMIESLLKRMEDDEAE
jgi:hypothetical protein